MIIRYLDPWGTPKFKAQAFKARIRSRQHVFPSSETAIVRAEEVPKWKMPARRPCLECRLWWIWW